MSKGTREQNRQNHRIEQVRKRDYVRQCKSDSGCVLCGYNKCSEALCFHHMGDDKEFELNHAHLKSYGIGRIRQEIEKCVVVCANCHAEIHAGKIEGFGNVKTTKLVKDSPQLHLAFSK